MAPTPVPFFRLWLVAFAAALALSPPAPVYWDTWGYVRQAIDGDIGGLGFGRPVFIVASQLVTKVWTSAGGSVWDVERALTIVWAAVSALSAPLASRLAIACGLAPRIALFAGITVACSPAMAHVAGVLLTDGPATALLMAAFVAAAGKEAAASGGGSAAARAIAAGVLLGLATGTREQAALGIVTVLALVWLGSPAPAGAVGAGRRTGGVARSLAMLAAFAATAAGPVIWLWATSPGYGETVRGWLAGMSHDRTMKSFGWRDAGTFAAWLIAFGPLTLFAAIAGVPRRLSGIWHPAGALFWVVMPSALHLLAMGTMMGTAYSPRYLALVFPAAIALPAGIALDRWTRAGSRGRVAAVWVGLVLPVLVAAPILRARAAPLVDAWREYPQRLATVPADAVIVTGAMCPAIPAVAAMTVREPRHGLPARPSWQPVCPGWSWPADLASTLDTSLTASRTVVVDLRLWRGTEQLEARGQSSRYAEERLHRPLKSGRLVVWH